MYVWGMMREGRGKITITKRIKNMIIPAHSQLHTNIYIAIHLYISGRNIYIFFKNSAICCGIRFCAHSAAPS